jgi:hypothetical protein
MISTRTFALCVTIVMATGGPVSAQSASLEADIQVTAITPAHQPPANSALRRTIGPAEARALWNDPQIKNFRGLAENSWNFEQPDSIPGFGTLSAEHAQKSVGR